VIFIFLIAKWKADNNKRLLTVCLFSIVSVVWKKQDVGGTACCWCTVGQELRIEKLTKWIQAFQIQIKHKFIWIKFLRLDNVYRTK
jgi:hypothetical protein